MKGSHKKQKTRRKGWIVKDSLPDWFKRFHLEKVKINAGMVHVEMSFHDIDKEAAWELYIEMLTRIVTQHLPSTSGDETTALDSIRTLFPTTREILRRRGPKAMKFSKVAIPVLNQVIRPFTAKWHKERLAGAFSNEKKRQEFRKELETLLEDLRNYTHMLANIAGVEDTTDLEQNE